MPPRCSIRWAARSGTGRDRAGPGHHRWCLRCSVGSPVGSLTPSTGPFATASTVVPSEWHSLCRCRISVPSRGAISGAEPSIHPDNAGSRRKCPRPALPWHRLGAIFRGTGFMSGPSDSRRGKPVAEFRRNAPPLQGMRSDAQERTFSHTSPELVLRVNLICQQPGAEKRNPVPHSLPGR